MSMTNKELVEHAKKVWREYVESGDLKKAISEEIARFNEEKKWMVSKHFPNHVTHEQTDDNWQYFDAMFLSYDLKCSCGASLTITRKMLEEYRKEEGDKNVDPRDSAGDSSAGSQRPA